MSAKWKFRREIIRISRLACTQIAIFTITTYNNIYKSEFLRRLLAFRARTRTLGAPVHYYSELERIETTLPFSDSTVMLNIHEPILGRLSVIRQWRGRFDRQGTPLRLIKPCNYRTIKNLDFKHRRVYLKVLRRVKVEFRCFANCS